MKTKLFTIKCVILGLLILKSAPAITQPSDVLLCGSYNSITVQQGKQISFFKRYPDFVQASLTTEDGVYMLKVVYKVDGMYRCENIPLNEQELASLCEEIGSVERDNTIGIEFNDLNQEARRRLITSTTTFSLGFYGWAVPLSFEATDRKAYTASYLFIGGSGFFGPLLATRSRVITDGMARGYTVGTFNGIFHGYSLGLLLGLDKRDDNSMLFGPIGFSLAESMTFLYLAERYNHSWGRMSIIGSGALWGTAYGYAIPYAFITNDTGRTYGATSLLLSGIGAIGANSLSQHQSITHGDATYINSMGVLGAFFALPVFNSFEGEDDRWLVGGALLSASAGLACGIYKTRKYDYSRQQGNLITLGKVAGGLIGGGLGVLFEANSKWSLWYSAIGATSGLLVTDYLVKELVEDRRTGIADMRIGVNPHGLLGAINHQKFHIATNDPRHNTSIVNISFSF